MSTNFKHSLIEDSFKLGDKLGFGNDRYCDWGPSSGHVVVEVHGKEIVIARDSKTAEKAPEDRCESDLWILSLSAMEKATEDDIYKM